MDGIKACMVGRLGGEPEMKYTQQGKPLCTFSVAANDGKAERGAPADWVRVTCWDALAEQMSQKLEKGMEVYAEGRLKLNTWEGKDGQKRSGLNLSAWTVQPIGAIGRPRHQEPLRGTEAEDEDVPF